MDWCTYVFEKEHQIDWELFHISYNSTYVQTAIKKKIMPTFIKHATNRPIHLFLSFRWGAELWEGARRAGVGAIAIHSGGAEQKVKASRGRAGHSSWTRPPAWRRVEEEEGLCGEGWETSECAGSAAVHLWEEGDPGDEAEDATRAGAEDSEGTTGKHPVLGKLGKTLISLVVVFWRLYSIFSLSTSEADSATRSDNGLPPRAPAWARGANPGPRGRHGALGAEVPGRKHHEAVCHGGGCHRRCTEVKNLASHFSKHYKYTLLLIWIGVNIRTLSFPFAETPPSLTTRLATPPTTASTRTCRWPTTGIRRWRTGSVPFTLRSWRRTLWSRSSTSGCTRTKGGRTSTAPAQTSWIQWGHLSDPPPPPPPSAPPWATQGVEVSSKT